MTNTTFSFRELDEQSGRPKGSAFRAFKRIEAELHQGLDFRLLQQGVDDAEIAALRQHNRIYRSSVNIVLLSEAAAAGVLKTLQQPDTAGDR